MSTIASPVANSAISIEMNEECVVINGIPLHNTPTIQQITELLSAPPSPAKARPGKGFHWMWDDLGIVASGNTDSKIDTFSVWNSVVPWHPDEQWDNAPQSPFKGPLTVLGVKPFLPDAQAKLSEDFSFTFTEVARIERPENPLFWQMHLGKNSARTILAHEICAPTITIHKGTVVGFSYPLHQGKLPNDLPLHEGENVLAELDQFLGNDPHFHAAVTNYRLVVVGPKGPMEWHLNDIKECKVRADVALEEGATFQTWNFGKNWLERRIFPKPGPPYHALDIVLDSGATITFTIGRPAGEFFEDIGQENKRLVIFELFQDCVSRAISRHKGRAPRSLPKLVPPADPATQESSASTAQESAPLNLRNGLISCPRCESWVSPKAVHCPTCGEPISENFRGTPQKINIHRTAGEIAWDETIRMITHKFWQNFGKIFLFVLILAGIIYFLLRNH